MTGPQSKITAQGQISVPSEIRKKLGVGPGSVLEWEMDGETVIIRRAGRFSSEDIHRVIFPDAPRPRKLADLKKGIADHMRKKHARG